MKEERKKAYAGVRKTILISTVLIPMAIFLLVLTVGYSFFTLSLENNSIASMRRIVQDHRQMIDSFLDERQADLRFILQSYDYDELSNPESLRVVFDRLQIQSNAFVDLGVFNEEGVHVAYQGPFHLAGIVYKEADWFKEVMKRGHYVSDVFLGYRRVPHFVIAMSRQSDKGRWVLRATIDTYVFDELVEGVHIGKTGEAYLLNKEGFFQTPRRSGGNLMDEDPDKPRYPAGRNLVEIYFDKDSRGTAYLYATTWLKDKDWILVVRLEKADAFKALHSATFWVVIFAALGGSAIFGLAIYLTERIVRKMEQKDMEEDRLRQQLLQASRLAELGEMAAGFAHEINNPLQIIHSEQALIKAILSDMKTAGQIAPTEDLKEIDGSIEQTKIQLDRCAKITQAILKFSRHTEPVAQNLDLKSFLAEVVRIIEKKATVHGIAVRLQVAEDTPVVHMDPAQLQQVFVNLFNNAIHAILERHGSKGGKLSVTVERGEMGNAEITVTDDGIGISPENLKKIFVPFFTTKPLGKGTGLGLSVCYGIVDSMGGTMGVKSEKGQGTTFTVRLPAAPQGASERTGSGSA